jgi:hypothetical protein
MQEDLQNEVNNPCFGCPATPSTTLPILAWPCFSGPNPSKQFESNITFIMSLKNNMKFKTIKNY